MAGRDPYEGHVPDPCPCPCWGSNGRAGRLCACAADLWAAEDARIRAVLAADPHAFVTERPPESG